MPDPNFFKNAGPFSVSDIAKHINAKIINNTTQSNDDILLYDMAALSTAKQNEFSWFTNNKYIDEYKKSKAGAILINTTQLNECSANKHCNVLLVHDAPYNALAHISHLYYPQETKIGNISDSAIIDKDCQIDQTAHISHNVVIGKRVIIGAGVVIGANSVIADGVHIKEGTIIGYNCSIEYAYIGKNCQIHSGARIGTRGFGFGIETNTTIDVVQTGRVIIGNFCEIGSNSTIDRGMGPDTVLGNHVRIDNLVQIAHNVTIGDLCAIASMVGIAGSTKISERVLIGGQAGITGHLTIAADTKIAAKSLVIRSIKETSATYIGMPAIAHRKWWRSYHWLQKQSAK